MTAASRISSQEVFDEEFAAKFKARGLTYEHRLIDDMVAAALKWSGNYRLGLQELRRRRAVRHRGAGLRLARPDDLGAADARRQDLEAEAAHGTVTRHYREHQQGKETSTNPIASIFAWTRGLAYRGKFDGTPDVTHFAETLEKVCIETVEAGFMTKDLAMLIGPDQAVDDDDQVPRQARRQPHEGDEVAQTHPLYSLPLPFTGEGRGEGNAAAHFHSRRSSFEMPSPYPLPQAGEGD